MEVFYNNSFSEQNLQPYSGFLNIYKEQGYTSMDVCAKLRGILGMKKIGHAGTLDPMAEGVLPVALGRATRDVDLVGDGTKTYQAGMLLGTVTDTQDITGSVLSSREPDREQLTDDRIREAVLSFAGPYEQLTPMYSARKVNGKKLYEYARAGQEVEIKPRKINIKHISVNNIDLENKEISFTVECSKGTYIRSLCADIGEKLGCGACMSGLVRTKTGVFTLDDTVDIEAVKKMSCEELVSKLFPTDYPLVQFGRVELSANKAKDFVNGKKIPKRDLAIVRESSRDDFYNVYFNDTFLGVAKLVKGVLSAHKVFDVRMQNVSI